MISEIPGLPDRVAGFVCSKEVTARDYETVVIPAVESRILTYGTIRILFQVAPDFKEFTPGAMWDDLKLGLTHLKAWEKTAVVTDLEWIRKSIEFFRFLIPYPYAIKYFTNAEIDEAMKWISE